jgi:hypothetical protein
LNVSFGAGTDLRQSIKQTLASVDVTDTLGKARVPGLADERTSAPRPGRIFRFSQLDAFSAAFLSGIDLFPTSHHAIAPGPLTIDAISTQPVLQSDGRTLRGIFYEAH